MRENPHKWSFSEDSNLLRIFNPASIVDEAQEDHSPNMEHIQPLIIISAYRTKNNDQQSQKIQPGHAHLIRYVHL